MTEEFIENIDCEESQNAKLKSVLNIRDLLTDTGTIFEFENNELTCDTKKSFTLHGNVGESDDSKIWSACVGGNAHADNSNSESEDVDDLDPFEKMALKMEDISGDGGVLKMEVNPGVCSDLPERARVQFHYSAFLEFADEPFDSTFLRDRPQEANLNTNDTLPGLRLALRTMRKNERSRFLVRADYAFGEMGCPPRIPPGATILYEVMLLNIVDNSAAIDFEDLDFEQQKATSFEEKMKTAKDYQHQGNKYYRTGNLFKAKNCYRRAACILEASRLKNEEEEKQWGIMIFKLHSNLAQVNLDLKEPRKACTECRLALEVHTNATDDMKVKIFYRFAKAKMYLSDFTEARKHLSKAHKIRPNSIEINSLMEKLLHREHKAKETEKVMCRRMIQMNVKKEPSFERQDKNTHSSHLPKTQSKTQSSKTPEISLLQSQLEKFASDPCKKEYLLPPCLSEEELNFAQEVAKYCNITIKKYYIGPQTIWKAVKERN